MVPSNPAHPPEHIYPPDPWRIVQKRFYPRLIPENETMFSVGNGYVGLRGTLEEGMPAHEDGTFINGFYEAWPIVYGEEAYGFAKTGQTMLKVTDTKVIRLYVDDNTFSLPEATVHRFERTLDMKTGTLDREVLWETPTGKRVLIQSRRLVSFQHRHLVAFSYRVTLLDGKARILLASEVANREPNERVVELDPRRSRGFRDRVLVPLEHSCSAQRLMLRHHTERSRLQLVCSVDHTLDTACTHSFTAKCGEDEGKVVYSIDAEAGCPIQLTKFAAYHTGPVGVGEELVELAEHTLEVGRDYGFDGVLAGQKEYLGDFWSRGDVALEANPAHARSTTEQLQRAIRFNLFHVLQASGRAETTGVAAKGLTGQAYEGQYFWDMEIYVMPFLTYTSPHMAKNLLKFRYRMLDKARQRARDLSQKGALFPWRTISGEEASAYYAAGTAQYHINADIAFALKRYVNATGDEEFLFEEGAEMLVETARLWRDLGFFSPRKGGKFCIQGVTGPDEYNTVVHNNTYTNLMARENLRYAAETVHRLREAQPEFYDELVEKTGLETSEADEWARAASEMYVPFDRDLRIHPQDEQFLDKQPWDLAQQSSPLLLYHHPLVIYRHRVIKQADIVLAMFLLNEYFSAEQKRRNFTYYDPLTTGDSSLSPCIQSIIAAELGYADKAVHYARAALLMDLGDVAGNMKDGCHIASMGGTWMVFVYGFAGMRDYNGRLSFEPRMPAELDRIRFQLTVRKQHLDVAMSHETATYRLTSGAGLEIEHQGEAISLACGEPVTVAVRERAD